MEHPTTDEKDPRSPWAGQNGPLCRGGCGFPEEYCDCSNYDSEGNEL